MNWLAMAAALAATAPELQAAAPAAPPAAGESRLLRVVREGKWGFIDPSGAVVIAPRFDRADDFSEGLAAVQDGRTQGYVDASGKLVLVPAYPPAGPTHRPFVDGRAVVRVGTAYGYIDRTGKLVLQGYARAEDFSGGLAVVCDPKVGCGYVDRDGAGVLGPGYAAGHPAAGGVACAVTSVMMGREQVRLLRADGKVLGDYEGCGRLSEGLIAVRSGDGWGYLDAEGRGVIPPSFAWAGDFSGGLAPARDDSGRCGYVGRDGAFVIPPRFRSCAPFSGGLARVDLGADRLAAPRVAFVDRQGRTVAVGAEADPAFDAALDFDRGLAPVAAGGEPGLAAAGGPRLGYLDTRGRYVWPPQN
jgi:hypothetical protein